jgi:hypothetical protein
MRMSIALPIAAALAIGLSSLSPAQTEAKILARCKSERAACVLNCVAYPCPQRCHAALAQCAAGAQGGGGGKSVKAGGDKPAPKGPVLGGSPGTNGGGLPIVKRIKR